MTIDTQKLRRLINLPMALGKLECQDGSPRFVRMRTVIDCDVEVWGRDQIDEYTERLWAEIDAQAAEIAQARQTADYWKAEHNAANAEIARLREALKFYADQNHFVIADDDAWDTVSGEPSNYWCDEAGTATVEDGSIAHAALSGEGK